MQCSFWTRILGFKVQNRQHCVNFRKRSPLQVHLVAGLAYFPLVPTFFIFMQFSGKMDRKWVGGGWRPPSVKS